MQVPKSDFDLVSYIRIILGSIHAEVLYFSSGFTVVALDIRGARRKMLPCHSQQLWLATLAQKKRNKQVSQVSLGFLIWHIQELKQQAAFRKYCI